MTTENPGDNVFHIGGLAFVKPAIWPVIITVLLVGLCIGLGVWQVQRLQWKEGLIAELRLAQQQSPITAEQLPVELADLTAQNFHSVSLMGEYDYAHEFHVIGRSNTEEPGYHVLTPFRLAGDGRMLMVNRGWIPQDKKAADVRTGDARSAGNIYLKGYILVPQGGSPFLPDHDVANNIWFWQDTARMAQVTGYDLPRLVIQRVDETQPADTLPMAKKAFDVQLRNDHFAYSLMWFSLAFSGIVIFAIYHRKPRGGA